MILEISSASCNNLLSVSMSTSIVSRIKQSQYFVSFADFKAMQKKLMKSFLVLPEPPSTTLALWTSHSLAVDQRLKNKFFGTDIP
jgi:hypothetical protein